MADLNEAFGSVLAKYRRRPGLSQEALAFECDLHPTYISQMERGIKCPTLRTIFRIADALSVSPKKMIGDTERLLRTLS